MCRSKCAAHLRAYFVAAAYLSNFQLLTADCSEVDCLRSICMKLKTLKGRFFINISHIVGEVIEPATENGTRLDARLGGVLPVSERGQRIPPAIVQTHAPKQTHGVSTAPISAIACPVSCCHARQTGGHTVRNANPFPSPPRIPLPRVRLGCRGRRTAKLVIDGGRTRRGATLSAIEKRGRGRRNCS